MVDNTITAIKLSVLVKNVMDDMNDSSDIFVLTFWYFNIDIFICEPS